MTAAASLQVPVGRPATMTSNRRPAADGRIVSRIRTELLAAFLEQMNAAQIPYCLLSGFQGYPDVIGSDVDFMIRPDDGERIAPLLLEVARRCGAQLVQAIRHETGAWYFVLAKQEGHVVSYLHPDCSTDYRRHGRLWLAAEEVLENRQRYKTFFVPSIVDEFTYYLTKKILKQNIASGQLQRIGALYPGRPDECRARMRQFWPETNVAAMEGALARQELGWMRLHLPVLLAELRASVAMEGWSAQIKQQLREWRRRLERVVNPTGLRVAVCGGTKQQRAELAADLEQNLRPAFRRTKIVAEEESGGCLPRAVSMWMSRVRSTLVIRKKEETEADWLRQDEICFVFAEAATVCAVTRERFVGLDVTSSLQQNVEYATRVTLEWMAARLRRRMKLTERAFAKLERKRGAEDAE
jgi:hypothetical protein